MKVVDLEKLNWRNDRDFVAVEGKLSRLEERERQRRNRLAELEVIVRDSEASLVRARVEALMEESTSQAVGTIQQDLQAYQKEIAEIREELDAVELAKRKLQRDSEAAAAEAKLRVAESLLQPYIDTARTLRARLDEAVEINEQLRTIHAFIVKQGITSEIHGNAALKPLVMQAEWRMLSTEKGERNPVFQYWLTQYESTFADR